MDQRMEVDAMEEVAEEPAEAHAQRVVALAQVAAATMWRCIVHASPTFSTHLFSTFSIGSSMASLFGLTDSTYQASLRMSFMLTCI